MIKNIFCFRDDSSAERVRENKIYSYQKSFTLAEVLIVLGIIGLIADMTIPTLISNTQEKIAVARLKKVHSTLENAFRLAVMENGTPDNWDLGGNHNLEGAKNILNNLAPHLIITKNCEEKGGCTANTSYKYLKGTNFVNFNQPSDKYVTAQLNDGTILIINTYSADCTMENGDTPALKNVCGALNVDINGIKPPNQCGVDYFAFLITKSGIIPIGTQAQGDYFNNECSLKSSGFGCAAWVIYNENMDYLHCSDLSWSGHTKCK